MERERGEMEKGASRAISSKLIPSNYSPNSVAAQLDKAVELHSSRLLMLFGIYLGWQVFRVVLLVICDILTSSTIDASGPDTSAAPEPIFS